LPNFLDEATVPWDISFGYSELSQKTVDFFDDFAYDIRARSECA
jgi:hypothetical protein